MLEKTKMLIMYDKCDNGDDCNTQSSEYTLTAARLYCHLSTHKKHTRVVLDLNEPAKI